MSISYRFLLQALLGLLLACSIAPHARALDERDLLPVDQAFVLSASAPTRDRIELRWQIADGYYMYRHRTAVAASGGFAGGRLDLPAGTRHVDEFFGPVETYRGELVALLEGQASGDEAMLEVKYQGCADIGICYPPQTRKLRVALPGAATASAGLPAAAGGALAGLPGQPALPETQAFSLDAIADGGNLIQVRLQPAPGYYIYRDRSRFVLEGDAGVQALAPRWPAGTLHRDEHFGEVVVYFRTAEVELPVRRSHARPVQATLVATFQGCQDGGLCYPPLTRRIAVDLPAGQAGADAPALAATSSGPGTDDTAATAADTQDAGAAPLSTAEPVSPDASQGNALRTAAPPVADASGLAGILLLALLGGLILNLMPCVLPVLSLKALGLAQSGESRQRARAHALWYTAGVLVAFATVGALVVGLRAAGQAAGWGFQLQQPWFVAALAYLMFAVGLSLSGVFTLGGGVGGRLAAPRSGPAGDFLTGVLACVVASPCIAPFMGPALAYAFAATPPAGMLVFLTMGLGLALPFLLIGLVPALARRLPQPGAWMETLKQVLAFPMYLTAVWLLWVLGKQRGVDAAALVLAGAALLALALWAFERGRWRSSRPVAVVALLLAAVALAPVWGVTRLAPAAAAPSGDAVAYSPQALDGLRAQDRVVFVNMTADWCVTCKANERNVLARAAFQDLLGRTDAVYMKGDWTNADPQIGTFLEEHKAVGVPLYVVYGPGAPPAVLPPVLTAAVVEDALLRAAAR
ncbi:cytochrome C biogenesis protein [Pseudoxanthomonas broegbernensis]|uniref:Cytochrome C biogenesis protein n=1 Tax=Pseudoxanthomonas broegbernensis TaxID=83619 RepID=A0A7V8GNM0_9GAMM|nr:protein-disulfide reductase DsbD [Pseudoxanthomonas broegbernensis]KAF1687215.1 cytochrome C biogenesis protein [Pseudoxanthomonas broegbernensis]MBB6065798.1 thiol:disulfide interchange protein DsbD [Pseudoxanthomonas broegbernensis]